MSFLFTTGQTQVCDEADFPDFQFLTGFSERESPSEKLRDLRKICRENPQFSAKNLPEPDTKIGRSDLPLIEFRGKEAGFPLLRVAIFAGIHGDEPEGVHALVRLLQTLDQNPGLAEGYHLFCYPVCNPTGLLQQTRETVSGTDINREFWKNSEEPEVVFLQQEIQRITPHGILALHTDDTSEGFYGYAHGAVLTENLIAPALRAAEEVLPRNRDAFIDGFPAADSIIRKTYPGILSAPPDASPKPFEIILETPAKPPAFLKEAALVLATQTILAEYRKLIAFADNI